MAGAATPIDDQGTVDIEDAPGWRYLPFRGSDDAIEVTVVRDGDGCELRFTVPRSFSAVPNWAGSPGS